MTTVVTRDLPKPTKRKTLVGWLLTFFKRSD